MQKCNPPLQVNHQQVQRQLLEGGPKPSSERCPSPSVEDIDGTTDDWMIDNDPECEEEDRDARRSLDLEPEVKIHIGKNIFVAYKSIDIREYFFLATKK